MIFVLVDVDEADGGVHQELILSRKAVCEVDESMSRRIWLGLFELLGIEHAAAHHEADRPARVHDVAADAAVRLPRGRWRPALRRLPVSVTSLLSTRVRDGFGLS